MPGSPESQRGSLPVPDLLAGHQPSAASHDSLTSSSHSSAIRLPPAHPQDDDTCSQRYVLQHQIEDNGEVKTSPVCKVKLFSWANEMNGRRWITESVWREHKPYFKAFYSDRYQACAFTSVHLLDQELRHSFLKVHKTSLYGLDLEPVADPWTLDREDQSDMIIYVEDLSPAMIEMIGSNFRVFPNVFEQHLLGSRYFWDSRSWGSAWDKQEEMLPAYSRPFPKSHASLRWHSVASLDGRFYKNMERANVDEGIYRRQQELFPMGTFACQERVTIFVSKVGSSRKLILFLDPIPRAKRPDGTLTTIVGSRATPRRPCCIDMSDLNDISINLDEFMSENLQTTYEDMQCWLRYWKSAGKTTRPMDALLEIIRIDTTNLIALLDSKISQVHGSLSDSEKRWLLRQEERHWRELFVWARFELPKLSESLNEMIRYMREEDFFAVRLGEEHDDPVAFFGKNAQLLIQQIADASTRTIMAQEAINAEMALINSSKGIAEAENVKRLTELAFIFIPMTFAAGLFSIQIREFQETPPRAWAFVVTAICLVALVYGIRISQHFALKNNSISWLRSTMSGLDSLRRRSTTYLLMIVMTASISAAMSLEHVARMIRSALKGLARSWER